MSTRLGPRADCLLFTGVWSREIYQKEYGLNLRVLSRVFPKTPRKTPLSFLSKSRIQETRLSVISRGSSSRLPQPRYVLSMRR